MEKSTMRIIYLMLMCMNYTEWSVVMHVNLQGIGLWEAIWHGGVEYHENKHMLAVLLHAEPVDMHAVLLATKRQLARRGVHSREGSQCRVVATGVH
jgi:hypothetical protein